MRWHLKQLLPLRYATTYTADGQEYACRWRMWLGRCFKVRHVRLT